MSKHTVTEHDGTIGSYWECDFCEQEFATSEGAIQHYYNS